MGLEMPIKLIVQYLLSANMRSTMSPVTREIIIQCKICTDLDIEIE